MAFNVSRFSAVVNKHGLAVTNLFVVRVTPPRGFTSTMNPNDLVFFCRSVKVPDYQMNIQTVKRYGFGPNIAYPLYMDNDVVNAEFMVDASSHVLRFFHTWQQRVYNYNSAQGPLASNNNQMVYELGYKKEYTGTLDIDVYSTHDPSKIFRYKYYDVWPMSVTHNTYAWANQAELDVLPVSFKYSAFTDDGTVRNAVDTGIGANVLGYTSAYNTVGQLINNTGVPQFLRDVNRIQNAVNYLGSSLSNFF